MADHGREDAAVIPDDVLRRVLLDYAEVKGISGWPEGLVQTYIEYLLGADAHVALARSAYAAGRASLIGQLEEASAVIILASSQVDPEDPVWVALDGFDGSGAACQALQVLGWRRSGTGGWYAPQT